jgi:hypothetical protein
MKNKTNLYWVCESNHLGFTGYWMGITENVFGEVPLDINFTADIHRAKKFTTKEECQAEISEWEIPGSAIDHMDVDVDFDKIKTKKLELLNSEGAILTAFKRDFRYEIVDQYGKTVANLNRFQLLQFLEGEDVIKDSIGRGWIYTSADEGMKPSKAKIESFIEPEQPTVKELKEILRWAYPHILESVRKEEGQYRQGCDLALDEIEEILGLTFKEMKYAIS